jgi:hypothetical protein
MAEFALLRPQKDSTLIENLSGAVANGSGPSIFAGRISSSTGSIRRALLEFDLASAIPPGSTVTKAVLTLNLASTNAGPVTIRLHRALAEWGEGASFSSGGSGAPAMPGDSTWVHRFYDDVFWALPGGDFDAVPRAAALVDQLGAYSWGSTQDMVGDAQSWLDDPDQNHGWILLGDETAPQTVKRFDSRESPEETLRPLLYVEFVPPCQPDPATPGYWQRQCAGRGLAESGAGAQPHFADWVLPCAGKILGDLGFPEIDACDAFAANPLRDCRQMAMRRLASLALNVCAARLQTSCPVSPVTQGCSAANVGELMGELAWLILEGDCGQASACAASSGRTADPPNARGSSGSPARTLQSHQRGNFR